MKSFKKPLAALTLVGGVATVGALIAQNTSKTPLTSRFAAQAKSSESLGKEVKITDINAASSPEQVPNPAYADAYKILRVTNAEGETSTIGILYVENVKSLWKTPITDKNETAIQAGTALGLEKQGIGADAALYMAKEFARTYSEKSALKKFAARFPIGSEERMSPSARPLNHKGDSISWTSNGKVAPYCIVNDLSKKFNGAQWIQAFVNVKDANEPLKLREEYGREFSDFVRDHEIAHCMGADEGRADYVAAKQMLKHHTDKAKAVRFLTLISKGRIIQTLWSKKGDGYEACDLTITKALQEHKARKNIMSDEQIWSQAKNTSLVNADLNYWASGLAFSLGKRVEQWANSGDFNSMGGVYKIAVYESAKGSSAKVKTALKYAGAFDTYAAIFAAHIEALQDAQFDIDTAREKAEQAASRPAPR